MSKGGQGAAICERNERKEEEKECAPFCKQE